MAACPGAELDLCRARPLADNRPMSQSPTDDLFVFARFHARPAHEAAVAAALLDVVGPTREEPGCLGVHACRSARDPRLFYIHSRWRDEPAFERHAVLPHTVRFLERVEPLIDHPLDVARARRLDEPEPGSAPAPRGRLARDGARDFDFLMGRWHIRHERLVARLQGCTTWETFEAIGEAHPLPGGLGNTDHFRTDHWPGFVGMSVRLYDPRARLWSIYWASTRTGTFEPPVVGAFADGVGVFEGRDMLDGRPILVRFVWSGITATGARWEQDFSPDEGRTWEKNWIMTFARAETGAAA